MEINGNLISQCFYVIKRNGAAQELNFDKINQRLKQLADGLNVNIAIIIRECVKKIYNHITTTELDVISAEVCHSFQLSNIDYFVLAGRILISNLHKNTSGGFIHMLKNIDHNVEMFEFVQKNPVIEKFIDYERDYLITYTGYKILENLYLQKKRSETDEYQLNNAKFSGEIVIKNHTKYAKVRGALVKLQPKLVFKTIETPQELFMRVAVTLFYKDQNALEKIKQFYDHLSLQDISVATPSFINSLLKEAQLNSCFLVGTEDSTVGIMKTVSDSALIGRKCGGIGIHMSNIRAKNSFIRGTNNISNGLVPQIKIYDANVECWNQGGKRKGANCIWLALHHADIMDFLKLKLPSGAEETRARKLFYGLWISDLFMRRFNARENFSLFSEDIAKGLSDVYDQMQVCEVCNYCENAVFNRYFPLTGAAPHAHKWAPRRAYTELYERYESEGLANFSLPADEIMKAINVARRETGTPFYCFSDAVNAMSNQANIGTIKSSNLCTEIMEYSDSESYACCILGNVVLPNFMRNREFDFDKLFQCVYLMTRALDNSIDNSYYPVPEARKNAQSFRPIAIGIQGLADLFMALRLPFLSEEAARLDVKIAETIYYAFLCSSADLAAERGPYSAFTGSPLSKGLFHFDLWKQRRELLGQDSALDFHHNWEELKQKIMRTGVRNSLGVAYMPTVSTSKLYGNNESFEPFNSNIFVNTTASGKEIVVNRHMVRHLMELGLWNSQLIEQLQLNNGSIQNQNVSAEIKELYKTIWEIPQKALMSRAALRGAFIDHSQSLNLHIKNNNDDVLTSTMYYGWLFGLKTGCYYTRTMPAAFAMKVKSGPICVKEAGCVSCS